MRDQGEAPFSFKDQAANVSTVPVSVMSSTKNCHLFGNTFKGHEWRVKESDGKLTLSLISPTRSSIFSGASSVFPSRFLWKRANLRPSLSAMAVTLRCEYPIVWLKRMLMLGTMEKKKTDRLGPPASGLTTIPV